MNAWSIGNLEVSKLIKDCVSWKGNYGLIIHCTQGFVIGQAFLTHFKFNFVYKTFICTQHFRNKFSEEMSSAVIVGWVGPFHRAHNTLSLSLFLLAALIAIGRYSVTIETVDVGWCKEITDQGATLIAQSSKSLRYLGLMRCDKVRWTCLLSACSCYSN